MKLVKTEDALGHILCHDLTQIIPGHIKDARFRKGHIVRKEDIPVLLSMGKEHLYIWEKQEGMLHEDEAVQRLRAMCQNIGMHPGPVKEGKIELFADIDGLFQVDTARLYKVNSYEDLMIATRHTNTSVHAGDKLAGTRIIPLVIKESILADAEKEIGCEPLLSVTPWKLKTAGVITTGNEVKKGLIQDQFTPVVKKKLEAFGIEVVAHVFSGDDKETIIKEIHKMKNAGLDFILCTGGMSVDPDDRTPGAISECGARVVSYGAPVLPGAMFCLGYFEDGRPIAGLPGCVMYSKATIFDLLLPRLAAGFEIKKSDLIAMGHGGLCFGCKECHYPNCAFGKGV